MSTEDMAKVLHEAARKAVEKNCVVRRDIPVKGFIEWDELDDMAREGRMIQAQYILDRYTVAPR